MSDKREHLEGQMSEAAAEAHEWKQLMEFPAFKRYLGFLEEQKRLREVTVTYTPISSEYSAMAQEFFKGEAMGLNLAITFPETQYQLADMKRRTLTKELELYEDAQHEVAARSTSRLDEPAFGE